MASVYTILKRHDPGIQYERARIPPLRKLTLVALAIAMGVSLLVGLPAQASKEEVVEEVEEVEEPTLRAPAVEAIYQLEPSLSFSCENGVCTQGFGDVRSNIPAEEVARRTALHDPAQEIVQEQLADLSSMHDATAIALEVADQLMKSGRGDVMLAVTVYLEEEPFDFRRLRSPRGKSGKSDAFKAVVKERRAQLRPSQDQVHHLITKAGGFVGARRILANILEARIPAKALAAIVGNALVVGVEIVGETKSNADGVERRLALGLPAARISGLPGIPDLTGMEGSTRSGGSEVLFGVIEANNSLNDSHVSFLDSPGGLSRIVETDRCIDRTPLLLEVFTLGTQPAIRTCAQSATTTNSTHGTAVTSVLLGSNWLQVLGATELAQIDHCIPQ